MYCSSGFEASRHLPRASIGRVGRVTAADGPSLAVVVSTYEWPEALDAVLRSLFEQSDSSFDVVVADDGSGPETRTVAERWGAAFGKRLAYVWQPDLGYRLARVRNLGALTATSEFLMLIDGDCVPRRHFVRAVRACAMPGWFIATNRVSVSPASTERILASRTRIHHWSLARWLTSGAAGISELAMLTPRDRRKVGRRNVPEFSPRGNAFCCVGVASADFEAVNGYDGRYVGWGDEDVDLVVRLRRLGLRCGHAGPQATPIHLWHASREVRERGNWWLLEETKGSNRIRAIEGLSALVTEPSSAGELDG